ncbi:LuxR C-terminal-related transcriptional regulator [Paenibacillus sp.]|uniref:LuxR C-terminal-related transcriptional regulator n=1 Tax=Paenibacillus sp. TaxID=58172 RepID=UPI00283AA608|nr:LuxR C-terminal-related transcriptional regulator [Paenibacillus sp.]
MNKVDKAWILMKDIEKPIYNNLINKARNINIDKSIKKIPYAIEKNKLEKKIMANHQLIHHVKREIEGIRSYLSDHYVFLLTDAEGIALYVTYNEKMASTLSNLRVMPGASFNLIHAGLNAISVAKEVRSTVVVSGSEHDLDLFKSCICICTPIYMDGDPIGYMNLSVEVGKDISFAIPLLHYIVSAVEELLMKDNPHHEERRVLKLLKLHGLTKREMEIALQWLKNYSVPRISSSLGITEGTVRNMLKKIYLKTNVRNKGEFIRRFM